MLVKRKVPRGTSLLGGTHHGTSTFGVSSIDFPDMPGMLTAGQGKVIRIDVIEDVAHIRYLPRCKEVLVSGPFAIH